MFKLQQIQQQQKILKFIQQEELQLTIAENEQYRWLTFRDTVQTVMDKKRPFAPVLPHLSAMIMALFYQPMPKNILEMGLGGGALRRFFHQHFATSTITSIELEPSIVGTYDEFFNPYRDTRNIVVGDAQKEIKNQQNVDIAFIDLYSQNGRPEFLQQECFYRDCFNSLTPEGILVANLISPLTMENQVIIDMLESILEVPVKVFSVPGFKNKIVMASRKKLSHIPYDASLMAMSQRFHLSLNDIIEMK